MEETPILQIKGTFKFEDEIAIYLVLFYSNRIQIQSHKISKNIKYSEIVKIKYNSVSIKIILKNGSKIKIPCTSSDINKIKTLFRIRKEDSIKEMYGSAQISLGNLIFIVLFKSNDFKEFKTTVFQKIAKHYYPACENDCLKLEQFDNLCFYLQLDDGNEVLLDGCDDLHAAAIFTDFKLKINIKLRNSNNTS